MIQYNTDFDIKTFNYNIKRLLRIGFWYIEKNKTILIELKPFRYSHFHFINNENGNLMLSLSL